MRYHKEGNTIMAVSTISIIALNLILYYFLKDFPIIFGILSLASIVFLFLIIQFFRIPNRTPNRGEELIISPADGKVVVIEEVEDPEYFKDKRIQVSIFMSPLNVHANYYPIDGKVSYYKYHPGKYLVAWHPKSSTDNERTSIVVKKESGVEVMMKQIAGAVARRIVCYAEEGQDAIQAEEVGFIKFGSRIDLLLPLGTEILVNIDDKVQGRLTEIARLKN